MNEIIDNVLIDNFFDNSQFNESLNFEDTFSRINVTLADFFNYTILASISFIFKLKKQKKHV